jgi:molybdate transport system permease protein
MFSWTAADAAIVVLSLKVAAAATIATAPVALLIALALARGRFAGRSLLNALVHLPLVVPPVVTGYVLLRLFGRYGAIGEFLGDQFGVVFAFRWTGAALAAGVMGLPLMVRAMQLAIENVDRSLEDAAATLGASPTWRFLTVTLPLSLPGISAGLILGFAKALGEFGATITFVSNIPGETRTLALAIYGLVETPGGDAAALRLIWLSVIVSLAALLASEVLARRMRYDRR